MHLGIAASALSRPGQRSAWSARDRADSRALSGGRFVLGVGTGWDADEFTAVGVPFGERGKRTDEHLAVIKALWRQELRGARLGISPRTPDGPPIWVGGHSDVALRRALRFADAWHGFSADPAAVAEVPKRLAGLAEPIGRDPATLALTVGSFLIPPGFRQAGPVPGHPLGGMRPSVHSVTDDLGLRKEAGLTTCSL